MTEYITPLPGILAFALETAVNRVLQLDMESPARVEKLKGRLLQVNLEGLGITLFFTFKHGVVRVRLKAEGTPDTIISGTPVALFSMAEPEEADWGLPDSKVQINGDASLARDLERIFRKLEPDWEGPLAGMFGDVAGHQLAQGLRQGAETARETARSASKVFSDIIKDRRS
ncbi:MAG: SCP2 sterol-binding domain-containing protein [Xanthomonadales bacterium]|nr:SCP2 sterol-binding domain-containing protein [Xanthomonadales bacterium]